MSSAVDKAEEVVEEVLRNPRLQALINNKVPLIVGSVAFASGAALGYFLGRRKSTSYGPHEVEDGQLRFDLEHLYDDRDDDRDPELGLVIDAEDYDVIVNQGVVEAGEVFVKDILAEGSLPEVIETQVIETPDEIQTVRTSIFAASGDNWDYDVEQSQRTSTEPYILHRDEFFAEEKGYTQITVTWYEADEIMGDDKDAPIYNWNQVIGDLKFGHGSGDANVFYVRNEARRTEYEVLRDSGSFAEQVTGEAFEPPEALQHSRFRDQDD